MSGYFSFMSSLCVTYPEDKQLVTAHERNSAFATEIPAPLVRSIFSYLNPDELVKCGKINKKWKLESSDDNLKMNVCKSFAFGPEMWKKYFGDVGEAPSLPDDIFKILMSQCPFNPGKLVMKTHVLALIPKTVNGEEFSFRELRCLAFKPKEGKSTTCSYHFDYEYDVYIKNFFDKSIQASHWVLMTRENIPGSGNLEYSEQCALLASKQSGYKAPGYLQALTCILTEFVRSGTQLYKTDREFLETRCCEELLISGRQVTVGSFYRHFLDTSNDNNEAGNRGHPRLGVAGVLELKTGDTTTKKTS